MIEIKSPQIHTDHTKRSIFLAGGISNCPDWQRYVVDGLIDKDLVILNPRRSDFQFSPQNEFDQVKWEYDHLLMADIILFWFPCETLCPITLFEYGKWLQKGKDLIVGTHPAYEKRLNIIFQTALEFPECRIYDCLDDMILKIGMLYR